MTKCIFALLLITPSKTSCRDVASAFVGFLCNTFISLDLINQFVINVNSGDRKYKLTYVFVSLNQFRCFPPRTWPVYSDVSTVV